MASPDRYYYSLVFPRRGAEVLLAVKTRKIGAKLYNGYGGKFEDTDRNMEACAARELYEEAGVQGVHFRHGAIVTCITPDSAVREVWVYDCQINGEPRATGTNVTPTWFSVAAMPYESMLAGDRVWLPRFLDRELLQVEVKYGADWQVEHSKIVGVRQLPVWRGGRAHPITL